jgi:hypothetical protein
MTIWGLKIGYSTRRRKRGAVSLKKGAVQHRFDSRLPGCRFVSDRAEYFPLRLFFGIGFSVAMHASLISHHKRITYHQPVYAIFRSGISNVMH